MLIRRRRRRRSCLPTFLCISRTGVLVPRYIWPTVLMSYISSLRAPHFLNFLLSSTGPGHCIFVFPFSSTLSMRFVLSRYSLSMSIAQTTTMQSVRSRSLGMSNSHCANVPSRRAPADLTTRLQYRPSLEVGATRIAGSFFIPGELAKPPIS